MGERDADDEGKRQTIDDYTEGGTHARFVVVLADFGGEHFLVPALLFTKDVRASMHTGV
jgi:hypothetical protein